eukprot:8632721-Alexandrium_andersonii.AAC.1
MTRTNSYSLSFRGRGHMFDADGIEHSAPVSWLLCANGFGGRFATPDEAQRPFQQMLDDLAN